MSSLSYVVSEQSAMWWVVAHKILLSAPVPIGIWIRGLGLGLDNTNQNKKSPSSLVVHAIVIVAVQWWDEHWSNCLFPY